MADHFMTSLEENTKHITVLRDEQADMQDVMERQFKELKQRDEQRVRVKKPTPVKKKEDRFFTSDDELPVPSLDRSKKPVVTSRSPVKRKNVLFDSDDSPDERNRAPSRRDSMYQRLGASLLDT